MASAYVHANVLYHLLNVIIVYASDWWEPEMKFFLN